jgi:CheY-like chemotaxis protein
MLVAEDRDEDVDILKLACQRAGVSLPLHFVRDGEEALEYLKGEGQFSDREKYPLPTLLLLDLNMPRLNGFEVLQWLRLQPGLRRLVVIIFTSSELPEDVNKAFELGANSYLVKPVDFQKLEETARYLNTYWVKFNLCPDCTGEYGSKSPGMRVLLRDPLTGRYYLGPDQWVTEPNSAMNFERSERAIQFAMTMRLPRFELVVTMQ